MQQRHVTWENFKQDLDREDPIVYPIEVAPDKVPLCQVFADENISRVGLRVNISQAPPEVDLPYQHIQTATTFENNQLCYEVFTSASPLYEPFYAMLTRMADLIQLNSINPAEALLQSIKQFSTLLSSPSILSREKQVGLWGELWILRKLIAFHGSDALGYWTGPIGEDHDLRFNNDEIEVKTTTGSARSHIISKSSQLEPSPDRTLHLLSLQLASGSGEGAFSLPQLVEDIALSLSKNPDSKEKFKNLLEKLGYNFAHEAYYADVRMLRSEPMLIEIDKSTPRITQPLLSGALGGEMSARISDVKYRLNVEGLGIPESNEFFQSILQTKEN